MHNGRGAGSTPRAGDKSMELSRRELLSASALLLVRPTAALSGSSAAEPRTAGPIVLCWNENPYGPSPAARTAISGALPDACRYPDDDVERLIATLAQHEGVSSEHIAVGSGSGELLRALGLSIGREGGELIIADPTYAELPSYARQMGAQLKPVPVDAHLRHDLSAMRAAVSAHTRAVYLCNPNNPTSTALPAQAIAAFVDSLPAQVMTIIDEAYMDFVDDPDVHSAAALVASGKRVVILRTFSKIHGMAGVRCGYALAGPELAGQLAETCMALPNVFAMRAARASLADRVFLTDCRRRILASRTRLTAELSRLGCRYAQPQGNFVFFDTGAPVAQFAQFMRGHNILVGREFPGYPNWCRITIGTESEVEAFLQGLHAYRARSPA
jgi:histidinol-phosphate aminotransferase